VWNYVIHHTSDIVEKDVATIELFDRDLVTDDYLGMATFPVMTIADKGPQTFDLASRPGKKDKVKGKITVEVRTCGGPFSHSLGINLRKYYAKKITGKDGFEESYEMEKIYDKWVAVAKDKEGTIRPIKQERVVEFMKQLNPDKVNEAEHMKATMMLYDDNADGQADFFEVMNFLCDAARLGTQAQGMAKFTLSGALLAVFQTGKTDEAKLRPLLTAFVTNPDKKDAEKLKETIDGCIKSMLEDLDQNKDGNISPEELRKYCLEGQSFAKIIMALKSVPDKKA